MKNKLVKSIPKEWPVQPLSQGQRAEERTTCGYCGLSWDDAIVTSMTPTPSARCPFEAFHIHKDETKIIWVENNTDSIDIEDKCLGMDILIENVDKKVYYNRGLHVQIKTNRDKKTFEQAVKITHLFSAAPEMLNALEHVLAYFEKYEPKYCGVNDDRGCSPYNDVLKAIVKAKGE
jgi:hypothetical protein